jgi:hypothetical protein
MPATVITWPEDEAKGINDLTTLELARLMAEAAREALGMVISDEHLILVSRFINACHVANGQESFDSWLRMSMFGRLSPAQQAYIVTQVEENAASLKKD